MTGSEHLEDRDRRGVAGILVTRDRTIVITQNIEAARLDDTIVPGETGARTVTAG